MVVLGTGTQVSLESSSTLNSDIKLEANANTAGANGSSKRHLANEYKKQEGTAIKTGQENEGT